MPQLLALEWNSREIRVAVASGGGRRIVVEHALVIPRAEEDAPGRAATPLGQRIAEELTARGIGRPETLVAVGRGQIELRQLQLPPAPDEELPDLVRFQAGREFNELDDRWLLDFVPLDRAADGSRTVLATAIAPAMIRPIEEACQQAGLKMRRLVLRSCAAASLLIRRDADAAQPLRLLIDLTGDEVDLTAVSDRRTVFLRTTRVAGDPPPMPALAAEIRLTIAAVQNQFTGRKVESLVLFGRDEPRAELARSLEAELGLRVELVDPWAGLELGGALRGGLPEHADRFAALLGALATELQPAEHAVDFLHPRRRPPPPNRRRTWAMAVAAVLLLPAAYLTYDRIQRWLVAEELSSLEAEIKTLDDTIAKSKKTRTTVADVGKWADGEIVWLDRLHDLNQDFPPAEDAVLGQLTFAVRPAGGQIDLKGWVRKAEVIGRMEESVRAHAAQVQSKSSREDASVRPYSWRFEASVVTGREAKP